MKEVDPGRMCVLTLPIIIVSTVVLAGCEAVAPRGTAASHADLPIHALSAEDMPRSWRPYGSVHASLNQEPWTAAETEEAARAVRGGLAELTEFFDANPESVLELKENAVECFIDLTYSSSNMPDVRETARRYALRNLRQLVNQRLRPGANPAECSEYPKLAMLSTYAHALYEEGDEDLKQIIDLTNSALEHCGSFDPDFQYILAADKAPPQEVYSLLRWCYVLMDAQTVPGLRISRNAKSLTPALWDFLEDYPLVPARSYQEGGADPRFVATAYLATHIGYMPTGYGRYPIYIEDAPWLYRFYRENFYEVLEHCEIDLLAEFVDHFRHYGCTEENDLQTRDGARYLLRIYRQAGNSWMNHREPGEDADNLQGYNLIHKPWTAIAGVRRRVVEPPLEGSYGALFRSATGLRQFANVNPNREIHQ